MRLKSLIILVLLVFSSCAVMKSVPTEVSDITLLEFGLFKIHVKKTINTSTTATGKHKIISDTVLVKQTSVVTAKLKDTFGIKYKINGSPHGETVNLIFKAVHPPIKGKTSSMVKIKGKIGSWRSNFFTFDEEYEMVEGIWKLQIWDGNTMLLEKVFTVKKQL